MEYYFNQKKEKQSKRYVEITILFFSNRFLICWLANDMVPLLVIQHMTYNSVQK